MINYEKFLEIYTNEYFDNLAAKADPVIESFIEYYGEKYRKKLTNDICNVGIYVFAPTSIKEIVEEQIPTCIFNDTVQNTYYFLSILGIPNIEEITYGNRGHIITDNNRIKIEHTKISEVYNTNNEVIDDLLEYIFGENRTFSFNYNNNIIYNFFNYDKAKQKEILKKVFKTDELTEDIYKKIKRAIEYMDRLKKETHGNRKYVEANLLYGMYKNAEVGKDEVFVYSQNTPMQLRFSEKLGNDPISMTLPNFQAIALPVLIMDDNNFIHEMNHIVTSCILRIIRSKYYIEKSGLNIINTYETRNKPHSKHHPQFILGEVINERCSQDITNILHNKGIYIYDKDHTYDLSLIEPYKELIPLVENFYQDFQDLIKETCITKNINILFKYIDKDNYEAFRKFIGDTYIKVFNKKEEELSDNHIDQANELTKKLKK